MTAHYDVCIIGGGIQGCGVAQAAAAVGYKVLLLEQSSLASATSASSSKLIHGGLRYLETAQFALVAQSLAERELLLKNAPELVQRIPFYIPVYKQTARRPWQIYLGLSLYAVLGRFQPHACFRRIQYRQYEKLDGLRTQGLQAVYQYWDAQTDDVELTRAVMYSAITLGAYLHCRSRFERAKRLNDNFQIDYTQDGREHTLTATCLVNATGPWIVQTQTCIEPVVSLPVVELVQGTHLLLQQTAPSGVYYVESPTDQRAVFIMPWHGHTLVGTTETVVTGGPACIKPTQHERDYLQNIVHHYFPLTDQTLLGEFAGARVLPHTEQHAFKRARDTLYFTEHRLPGYVALVGGKLTGYRIAAQKVLQKLQQYLPPPNKPADTRQISLVRAPAEFGG